MRVMYPHLLVCNFTWLKFPNPIECFSLYIKGRPYQAWPIKPIQAVAFRLTYINGDIKIMQNYSHITN